MGYERDTIRRLKPYAWGEQPDSDEIIKLNTNENPYPPSPRVQEALAALNAEELRRYPPPTADGLRDRLAELHGVQRHNIVATNGGDEGLRLAITTFVDPGSGFGMLDPSYSLYAVLAAIQDARIIRVAADEAWSVPRDFAQTMNDAGVRLTCLVNPHAPSGTLIDGERISRLANELDGVLLVDEAYVDFVDPALRHDLVRLIDAFDNLLLLRTFSKGYGLAGLRLGYLLGCESLIQPILEKTRDSYNLNLISQRLGEAALADRAYAEDTWRRVRQSRRALREGLLDLGFDVDASQTNFLLAGVPLDFPLNARALYEGLKSAGILVRWFSDPVLEDKLRISVGTEQENAILLATLETLMNDARQ